MNVLEETAVQNTEWHKGYIQPFRRKIALKYGKNIPIARVSFVIYLVPFRWFVSNFDSHGFSLLFWTARRTASSWSSCWFVRDISDLRWRIYERIYVF